MTDKPLSRQRIWQKKHKELGLCQYCSHRAVTKMHCRKHMGKSNYHLYVDDTPSFAKEQMQAYNTGYNYGFLAGVKKAMEELRG